MSLKASVAWGKGSISGLPSPGATWSWASPHLKGRAFPDSPIPRSAPAKRLKSASPSSSGGCPDELCPDKEPSRMARSCVPSPALQRSSASTLCPRVERLPRRWRPGVCGAPGSSSLSAPPPRPSSTPCSEPGLSHSSHRGLPPCSARVSLRALLWGPVEAPGAGTSGRALLRL